MARLKAARARLAPVAGRLGAMTVEQGKRVRPSWWHWYNNSSWRELRWRVLVRDRFTCQMCGVVSDAKGTMVADHKVPHRGDAELFWDESNVQALCKPCHDGAKQRAEKRGGW